MTWTNLQQENWMQVNNFILNNIPENIMILDFAGQTKFICDYCKSFMEKCNLALDAQGLLRKIRHLQRVQSEVRAASNSCTVIQIERLTTENELIPDAHNNHQSNTNSINTLEDIIVRFKNIRIEKVIQERHFLVYSGKLELENSQQEKSIEIKISFSS